MAFEALAGTWRGGGKGHYPTIQPFEYLEELIISPVPERPVAGWVSRTRDAVTLEPRHGESGYLRVVDAGVELVLAHTFGVLELCTGSLDDNGTALEVSSISVVPSPTAKRIDRIVRNYRLDGNALRYDVSMAAVGIDLTHHLSAELRRQL